MLEGPVFETTRELTHGGSDLFYTNVYWLFPSGVVRGMSPR